MKGALQGAEKAGRNRNVPKTGRNLLVLTDDIEFFIIKKTAVRYKNCTAFLFGKFLKKRKEKEISIFAAFFVKFIILFYF